MANGFIEVQVGDSILEFPDDMPEDMMRIVVRGHARKQRGFSNKLEAETNLQQEAERVLGPESVDRFNDDLAGGEEVVPEPVDIPVVEPKPVGPTSVLTGTGKDKFVEAEAEAQAEIQQTLQDEEALPVIDEVFDDLALFEGAEGDTTGAAETGRIGVTAAARQAVGGENLSDEQVAKQYLGIVFNTLSTKLEGFEKAPREVQKSLLDAGYNLGQGIANFKGLRAAFAKKDWKGVGLNLLDTASIAGKASRGLARRRADYYNRIVGESQSKITHIEQKRDGTLIYLSGDSEVFKYKPSGGRHPSSGVGKIRA